MSSEAVVTLASLAGGAADEFFQDKLAEVLTNLRDRQFLRASKWAQAGEIAIVR